MSIFNNESILAWLKYFSDHSEIDLSTVRILDITGENRNLLPTVQANRSVLVFTDGNHPEIFYSMADLLRGIRVIDRGEHTTACHDGRIEHIPLV